tara:strand:+ start:155 stop:331 length:177 start_codon:yes stop_codon:yes gene_type:complete
LPQPEDKKEIDDEDEEEAGKNFKVLLEKIENDPVKISRKNCCTIELLKSSEDENESNE